MLSHPRLITVLTLYWNMLSWATLTVHDTSSSKNVNKIVLKLHWFWATWLVIMGKYDYKPHTSKCLTKSRKTFLVSWWMSPVRYTYALISSHLHITVDITHWLIVLTTDCFRNCRASEMAELGNAIRFTPLPVQIAPDWSLYFAQAQFK